MNYFKEVLASKSQSHITSSALLCENAHNHLIFKKEKNQNFAAHLKALSVSLSEKGCKRKALAHLLVVLPQCSKDYMITYGPRWIRDCSQILKVTEDVTLTPALLTVMRVVLRCCRDNQELTTKVSKLNGVFVPQIYSVNSQFGEPACLCLLEFLRQFPTQVLSHKNSIEAMLMSFIHLPLSSSAEVKVSYAARCFAVLPVPGQTAGIVEAKRARLDQLMALAHSAMDELFKDVQESESYGFSRAHKLPQPTLDSIREIEDHDPLERMLMAARQTGNCFTFIRIFIETTTTEVRPRELVRLALRVLQVKLKLAEASGAIESMALAFVLPSIHTCALKLLQGLIDSNVCEPFMRFVEEQLVATLMDTHDQKVHKSNLLVRSVCYETLTLLIQVSGGLHVASLKTLMPVIIKDTFPNKGGIQLRSTTRGARMAIWSVKKKSKKKGYTVVPAKGSATDNAKEDALPDGANDFIPTTVAVLSLLEALFLHAHHALTGEVVRVLQEHIWNLLAFLRRGEFADPRIRAGLYGTLVACGLHPHPLCPPPYTLIHRALEEGARDTNLLVSRICSHGLATLSFVSANPSVASWADAAWQTLPTTTVATAGENSDENVSQKDDGEKIVQNGGISEEEESEMSDDECEAGSEDGEEDDSRLSILTADDGEENEQKIDESEAQEMMTLEKVVSEHNESESESRDANDGEGSDPENAENALEPTPIEVVDISDEEDIIALSDHDDEIVEIVEKHDLLKQNDLNANNPKDDEAAKTSCDEEDRKPSSESGERGADSAAEEAPRLEQKRKKRQEATDAKKLKKQDTNTRTSPSMEAMLSAFVDTDPDSD